MILVHGSRILYLLIATIMTLLVGRTDLWVDTHNLPRKEPSLAIHGWPLFH